MSVFQRMTRSEDTSTMKKWAPWDKAKCPCECVPLVCLPHAFHFLILHLFWFFALQRSNPSKYILPEVFQHNGTSMGGRSCSLSQSTAAEAMTERVQEPSRISGSVLTKGAPGEIGPWSHIFLFQGPGSRTVSLPRLRCAWAQEPLSCSKITSSYGLWQMGQKHSRNRQQPERICWTTAGPSQFIHHTLIYSSHKAITPP